MSRESVYAAEQVVLGRILEADDSDFVSTAVSTIGPHALSDENHRTIFKAAADLHAAAEGRPDLRTITVDVVGARSVLRRPPFAVACGDASGAFLSRASSPDRVNPPDRDLPRMKRDRRALLGPAARTPCRVPAKAATPPVPPKRG